MSKNRIRRFEFGPSYKLKMNFAHLAIIGLTIFYPLEEFLEKWIPRGIIYELVRYGTELIILTLLIWIIITRSIIPGKWKTTPIDFPLLILLMLSLISTIFNDLPLSFYLLGLRPIIRFIVVFYIIVQLGYNRKFSETFSQTILIVASFVCMIAILQSLIGLQATYFLLPENVEFGGEIVRQGARQFLPARTRVFSTLGRYDTLGTYLSIVILLITSLYWKKMVPKKNFIIFLVLSVPALILSYSRQSWLVTTVGIVILMVLNRKHRHLLYLSILGGLAILIILVFFSGYVYYSSDQIDVSFLNRMLEPFSQRYLEISRNNYGRLFVIIEVSQRILEKAPLIGFGPGNFCSLKGEGRCK